MRLTHRHHRLVALALLFAAVAMLISPAHAQEKIEGKIDEKPALPDKTPVAIAKGTRVFIVSIDGARPDLLLLADAPNARHLMKTGSYSMWAQTIPIGKTLPSHTSMLTGVSMEKHGIFWNEDWLPRRVKQGQEYPRWAPIFERAKEIGLTTAICAGKTKFEVLAKKETVDYLSVPEAPKTVPGPGGIRIPVLAKADENGFTEYDRKHSDDWVARNAEVIIRQHKPQVMFVHFGRVDSAGHSKGWGSKQQLAAIEEADKALGKVLDALRTAKVYDETLIILSADHGGYGRGHDGKDPRGLHIPWIVAGPGIRKGYDLTQQSRLVISTMDTFATACDFLGVKFKIDDEIEGKVIREAYEELRATAP